MILVTGASGTVGSEVVKALGGSGVKVRAGYREIRYVPISPEQLKQGALAMGMPEVYVDALVDLDRHYAAGKLSTVTPAVREITGCDPIRFEQFAKDYADKFRP